MMNELILFLLALLLYTYLLSFGNTIQTVSLTKTL